MTDTNSTTTTATKPIENPTIQQNQKKQRNRKQELNTKPLQQVTTKSLQQPPSEVNRPPKSISPDVPEQMVPLENYYYGTIVNYTKSPKITLNMKCPFCKSIFDNNILLMNHLFKHAHNVSQDAQLCRYCLTSVPTANDLLKHIGKFTFNMLRCFYDHFNNQFTFISVFVLERKLVLYRGFVLF